LTIFLKEINYDHKSNRLTLIAILAIATSITLPANVSCSASQTSSESDPSWNENIVFANLHIIQAMKDLLDQDTTEALNQLEQAQEQLDRALSEEN
jgi:hypothetical protein